MSAVEIFYLKCAWLEPAAHCLEVKKSSHSPTFHITQPLTQKQPFQRFTHLGRPHPVTNIQVNVAVIVAFRRSHLWQENAQAAFKN
jgi:hypothetical protein